MCTVVTRHGQLKLKHKSFDLEQNTSEEIIYGSCDTWYWNYTGKKYSHY